MTTLSTDVSARAKLFRTSDAFTLDSRLPIPVTIGSEHLSVNARTTVVVNGVNVPAVIVTRGLDGTTPATHAAGSTLTVGWGSGAGGSISATDGVTTVDPATSIVFPTGTITDVGGGVAAVAFLGVLLTTVVDVTNSAVPVKVFDLNAGDLLVRSWVLQQDDGSGMNVNARITLSLAAPNGDDSQDIIVYDVWNNGVAGYADKLVEGTPKAPNDPTDPFSNASRGAYCVEAQGLFLTAQNFTTGQFRVQALIATPAA